MVLFVKFMLFFNIFIYVTVSVIIFIIAKFLWKMFKLIFFKFLIDNFVDFVIDDEEDDSVEYKKKENKTNKEDRLSREKVKEVLVEVERVKKEQEQTEDMSVDFAQKTVSTPKIVGVKVQVFGKFTQMLANKMGIDLQNVNRETLVNKGYHQAMLEMQRGQSMGQGQGFGVGKK
jgi:ABC-type uncharacterized transport system fused permease/ATPase subunit